MRCFAQKHKSSSGLYVVSILVVIHQKEGGQSCLLMRLISVFDYSSNPGGAASIMGMKDMISQLKSGETKKDVQAKWGVRAAGVTRIS